MSAEVEEWRPVVGWEGLYEVSSLGRVRSLDRVVMIQRGAQTFKRTLRGKILAGSLHRSGYLNINLLREGVTSSFKVHRLVCAAFHGPCPEGHEVAHGNGDRVDNRANNLRWATRIENMADCVRHGTAPTGERHPVARLTWDEIRAIRASKDPCSALAARYGVSRPHITNIRKGSVWKSPRIT